MENNSTSNPSSLLCPDDLDLAKPSMKNSATIFGAMTSLSPEAKSLVYPPTTTSCMKNTTRQGWNVQSKSGSNRPNFTRRTTPRKGYKYVKTYSRREHAFNQGVSNYTHTLNQVSPSITLNLKLKWRTN